MKEKHQLNFICAWFLSDAHLQTRTLRVWKTGALSLGLCCVIALRRLPNPLRSRSQSKWQLGQTPDGRGTPGRPSAWDGDTWGCAFPVTGCRGDRRAQLGGPSADAACFAANRRCNQNYVFWTKHPFPTGGRCQSVWHVEHACVQSVCSSVG